MSSKIIIKGPVVRFWRQAFSVREHAEHEKPDHQWGVDDHGDSVKDCQNALRHENASVLTILDDSEVVVVDEQQAEHCYSVNECELQLVGIIQTKCDLTDGLDVLFGQQKYANAVSAEVCEKNISPNVLRLRYKLLYHPQRGWLRILVREGAEYMFSPLKFEVVDVDAGKTDTFWTIEGRRYMKSEGNSKKTVDACDIASDRIDLHPKNLY